MFGEDGTPEMDPEKFETLCHDAGAKKFLVLFQMPSVWKKYPESFKIE